METLIKKSSKSIINIWFYDDVNSIDKKLVESETSSLQSLESAYLEWWKK
jgi:hypothetical protein